MLNWIMLVFFYFSWFFAKNCPKMTIFFIFGGQFLFHTHPLYLWPTLLQLWTVLLGLKCLIMLKNMKMARFSYFSRFFAKNCQKIVILGPLFAYFFYFWTFIPINIMVKTSFERSMCLKCVLGCTYVLQRLVSIDFLQFCKK